MRDHFDPPTQNAVCKSYKKLLIRYAVTLQVVIPNLKNSLVLIFARDYMLFRCWSLHKLHAV